MKEATGELSGALVAVVCIATLVAFFYFQIWPSIKVNFQSQTACDKAKCDASTLNKSTGLVNCTVDGQEIQCKFKG